jgi:hypothetical protein
VPTVWAAIAPNVIVWPSGVGVDPVPPPQAVRRIGIKAVNKAGQQTNALDVFPFEEKNADTKHPLFHKIPRTEFLPDLASMRSSVLDISTETLRPSQP